MSITKQRLVRTSGLVVILGVLLLIAVVCYRIARFDPRFVSEGLRGRTEDEIIAEFGSPWVHTMRQVSPEGLVDGALFEYHGPLLQIYDIKFDEQGRVLRVTVVRK